MLYFAIQLLVKRVIMAIPILTIVSIIVFVILRLLPADPIAMSLPPGASAADYAQLKAAFGLDRPVPEQYLIWLRHIMSGDFGGSIFFRQPVTGLVVHALKATLELVTLALCIGIVAGLIGGLTLFALGGGLAAVLLDGLTTVMMAIPEFLWALIFILFFGVTLQWLPFVGRLAPDEPLPPRVTDFLLVDCLLADRYAAFFSVLRHLILPASALAIGLAPLIMRVLRSSLLETIGDDYVTQARLRGTSERTLLLRHALPNAVLPTLSLIGVQGGFMFGGTVLVEMIFAYPGLGNLMVDAIRNQDLPVIQAVALVYCVLVLAINAVVDIIYYAVNPKLRLAGAR